MLGSTSWRYPSYCYEYTIRSTILFLVLHLHYYSISSQRCFCSNGDLTKQKTQTLLTPSKSIEQLTQTFLRQLEQELIDRYLEHMSQRLSIHAIHIPRFLSKCFSHTNLPHALQRKSAILSSHSSHLSICLLNPYAFIDWDDLRSISEQMMAGGAMGTAYTCCIFTESDGITSLRRL